MYSKLFQKLKDEFGSYDHRIYILAVGWLVTSAGFAIVIPFLSIYLNRELGISMTAIGVFFVYTAVLRSIPQPYAGRMSDRYGRVPMMGWSQILRAITFCSVAYVILSGGGFWLIALVISFNYIFGSILHPASNAMVADLVRKEQRVKAYAMLRIAGNLGWAVGPAAGGFIAQRSYSALFLIGGVAALASGVFFLIFLRDVPRGHRVERHDFTLTDVLSLRKDRLLIEHSLISFLLFLVVAQMIAALSLYSVNTVGISENQLGLIYGINGGLVVVLQYPVSHIFRKMRLTHQMALGSVIYAIGYFLVGLAPGFGFIAICMVIITIAETITSPPSVTIVANLSPPGEYGRYMGLFGMFQMAGWSIGPFVGGALLDIFSFNPVFMWLSIAVMALIAFLLFINFGRKLTGDANSGTKSNEAARV